MSTLIVLLALLAPPGQESTAEPTALTEVDDRDPAGRTALIRAAMEDQPSEVERLLEAGAAVDATDSYGFTALLYAAQYSLESVELLLAAGADVDYRNDLGTSALAVAREAARADIEALLREHGAQESPEERLDAALRAGDREEVKKLIAGGADVDALDTGSYQTPLMTAIEARDIEAVLILLEAGADPTRQGTGIETTNENALSYAARQGSTWVLRKLLERPVPRPELERALIAGCEHPDVMAVLLERGVSPNVRGSEGLTPLMCAAAAGAEPAVTFLIEAGADRAMTSAGGESAADMAEAAGERELAARLRR